jgi:hypothetical protein
LNVPSGYTGLVTFTVSTTEPASGFYLAQTNEYVGDSIYLSGNFVLEANGSPAPIPEPTTLVVWSLLGSLAVGLGWWRKRKAA